MMVVPLFSSGEQGELFAVTICVPAILIALILIYLILKERNKRL